MSTTRRTLLGCAIAGSAAVAANAALPTTAAAEPKHSRKPNLVSPFVRLPNPFWKTPLRKCDSQGTSEGYFYGKERTIHGSDAHAAVDLNAPFGSPVLAPANSYAVRTYQSWLTTTVYTDPRTGKTGRIGFGLGECIFLLHFHPELGIYSYTILAHLMEARDDIHYLQSWQDSDGDWHEGNGLYIPDPDLAEIGTPVEAGEVIAKVGNTGIEFGERERFDVTSGHVDRDPHVEFGWDTDAHVHAQLFQRQNGSPAEGEALDATKRAYDPFGHYLPVHPWRGLNPYDNERPAPGHVMLTDRYGMPAFAG